MSKLPNAPLIEVIFELRWTNDYRSDLEKFQYLHGDLYSNLKQKYPEREILAPPEIPAEALLNKPVHRFRAAKNYYPLFQVGPGLVSLNTIDEIYEWNTFYRLADELLESIISVSLFEDDKIFFPNLIYWDFFEFDFENNNVNQFINDNFNIEFNQNFIEAPSNPNNINLGFYYKISEGDLSVNFKRGNNKEKQGFLLQTRINGEQHHLNKDNLLKWLSDAHEYTSSIFKNLTEGSLYESFKLENDE